MSFGVHRLRFGDWSPLPIVTIATDPFSGLVAVGRLDGEIEIYDPANKWYVRARVPGRTDFQLQNLIWSTIESEKSRLFGVSLRGFIFEVSLSGLTFTNISDCYGGSVWAMDASIRDSKLALGCEDGSVKIFDYGQNSLSYRKTFPSTGTRILCVAFHPKKPLVFCGCCDGTIRCLDEITGLSQFRMTGHLSNKIGTFIVALRVLKDSTVVSGDNHGHVQFWDSDAGVQITSLFHHNAEIRSITVDAEEDQVFASGVDSRVTCFRRVSDSASDASQWVYTTSHRPHAHDVYSLSIVPKYVSGVKCDSNVLVSGGLDGKLCLYSVEDFAKVRPTWILPLPAQGLIQCGTVSSSKENYSILSMKHRNHIDLWSLDFCEPTNTLGEVNSGLQLGATIRFKFTDNLHCVSLSSNGKYLSASSASGLRLWKISRNLSTSSISTEKLSLPEGLHDSGYALAISFSADSRRLAICLFSGKIILLDIDEKKLATSVHLVTNHHRSVKLRYQFSDIPILEQSVSSLSFSSDAQYLAVSSSGRDIYVYDTDRLRLHWIIPPLQNPISCLQFHPHKYSWLVVMMASNEFLIFDIEAKQLTSWSSESRSLLPKDLLSTPTPFCGFSFGPSSDQTMVAYSQNAILHVNLTQEIPNRIRCIDQGLSNRKRKVAETNTANFAITSAYRNLVHVSCINDSQLIVVENPWARMVEKMPEVVARKRYGT